MQILFINPNSKVNFDIPNIDLAFIATHYNAKVIDYNTLPKPVNRHLNK